MVYLIGYMGVGKTTIAKQLAKQLNIPFTDTDKAIERKTAKCINTLFQNDGEMHFRNLEKALLHQIKGNQIIACGGGLPIYNNNMDFINSNGVSIYLKANTNTLVNRLKENKVNRPLINKLSDKDLKDFIEQQLILRNPFYTQAKHIVVVDNKSETEILREINALLLSL